MRTKQKVRPKLSNKIYKRKLNIQKRFQMDPTGDIELQKAREALRSKLERLNLVRANVLALEKDKLGLFADTLLEKSHILTSLVAKEGLKNDKSYDKDSNNSSEQKNVKHSPPQTPQFSGDSEPSAGDNNLEDEVFIVDDDSSFFTPSDAANVNILAKKNPFYTPVDEEESVNLSNLETPEARKKILGSMALTTPLVKNFLSMMQDPSFKSQLDLTNTGIRLYNNTFLIGNSKLTFHGNKITMDNNRVYKATKGLLSLLFLKEPDKSFVSHTDLDNYKQILVQSSAHLKRYSTDYPLNSNVSYKFRNYIKQLFPRRSSLVDGAKTGEALSHFTDYNALIERLQILIASQKAGGNSHINEISEIIHHLRSAGIIL
jgi:hypothetical protein